MSEYGFYLNGVYESVLEEIINAQSSDKSLICYLQPYKEHKINWKNSITPSLENPIECYISLTTSLAFVTFKAEIVNWELKNELSDSRLDLLNNHIRKYQPEENKIFMEVSGTPCTNLLSIVNLQRIDIPIHVLNLIKISDSTPYKPRTQSGGWSYVSILPDWVWEVKESVIADEYYKRLDGSIEDANDDSKDKRMERLKNAPKLPDSIQIIQKGFKRNADVISTVLERANGVCENCNQDAPFIGASKMKPYLEVHHKILLSKDGEDTVENAMALCPNCHKEFHFGVKYN
jgi:5-methylcytosine-specific restriction enzyme A